MKSIKNLFAQVDRVIDEVTSRNVSPSGMRLFQVIIYSWVLLSTLVMLPAHQEFWGPNALIANLMLRNPSWIMLCINLLSLHSIAPYYELFIGAQIVLLILAIFGIGGRLGALGIYFFTINLNSRAWITMDGGNNLINLILFYLIFLNPSSSRADPKSYFSQAHYLFNNLAYLASRVQVVVVYLGAGLTKITGPLWQKGVALYYVLNTEEYSHPSVMALVASFPVLIMLATYMTLVFQISFPWLVWNRKLRPWILSFGTFLHLQISFVMGLFLFGLAMCASYTAFTPEHRAKKVLAWLGLGVGRLTVGFDPGCSVCQSVARVIGALDWRNRVVSDSADSPLHPSLQAVPYNERLKTIHGFDEASGEITQGFNTIAEALVRLPILLLLVPLIRLLQITGLGEYGYRRWILTSTWRVPCSAGVCSLISDSERVHPILKT
jgi:predicted DCC family thiol-disulfide oxidoreductase YuxK